MLLSDPSSLAVRLVDVRDDHDFAALQDRLGDVRDEVPLALTAGIARGHVATLPERVAVLLAFGDVDGALAVIGDHVLQAVDDAANAVQLPVPSARAVRLAL